MQVFWWLFGSALFFEVATRGILLYLARLARRGVSGTEIIALALAPVFFANLVLRIAGIASAFVLAASRNGHTSAALYTVGSLWSAVTLAEAAQTLHAGWRTRHPRAKPHSRR